MKPIELKLQAFGPYAKQALIDFRELDQGGLFLIHGQTGAGKTSLLDGICFALFGRASGADRSPEGLRSDLASSDLPTEAVLTFSLGSAVYRSTRTPPQVLKKKRGDGVTTSKPDGRLEKQASDGVTWDLIAAGEKKSDSAVIDLLGMNEDQFRQVVVLPQGQFRKFLASGSDEREELLERLFKTARYRLIGEELESQAKKIQTEYVLVRNERDALLAALDVKEASELDVKTNELTQELADSESNHAEIEMQHKLLSVTLQTMREQVQRRQELRTIDEKKTLLTARRPAFDALVLKLAAHTRTLPVLQVQQRVLSHTEDLSKLNAALAKLTTDLPRAKAKAEEAKIQLATMNAKAPEIEASQVKRERLKEIFRHVEKWNSESVQLVEQDMAIQKLTGSITSKETSLLDLKSRRPPLEKEIARCSLVAGEDARISGELVLMKRQILDINEAVRLGEQLCLTDQSLANETTGRKTLDGKLTEANLKLKTVKLEYHRSQASRLATELLIGEPCPVCGSLEHPLPAPTASSDVSLEQVETQETAVDGFLNLREKSEAVLARLTNDRLRVIETLKHVFPDWNGNADSPRSRQAEQLKHQTVLTAEKEKATQAQQSLGQNQNVLTSLTKSIESSETELQKLKDDLTAGKSQYGSMTKSLRQLESLIPDDLRDLEAVRTEGLKLKAKYDQFTSDLGVSQTAVETAAQELTHLQSSLKALSEQRDLKLSDLKETDAECTTALLKSEFATVEQATTAVLTAVQVSQFENDRRGFEKEEAAILSRSAELTEQLAGCQAISQHTLESTENEFTELDRQRAQRAAQGMTKQHQLEGLKNSSKKIVSLQERVAVLEKRYSIVGRLADASAGRAPNLSRVGFQRYVLGSRLDEVLEQASQRLHTMSRGQFTLRRSRQVDDKRKNAGLDLEVEDSLTGTTRPTASLSGGEGFLASLALALGLADVVQSHLGGIRLDAVFVDEGFGTLDPEALEQAMRTLTDLQAGGRLVGVISHVPELRDQIARRLIIKKGVEGSTVAWE